MILNEFTIEFKNNGDFGDFFALVMKEEDGVRSGPDFDFISGTPSDDRDATLPPPTSIPGESAAIAVYNNFLRTNRLGRLYGRFNVPYSIRREDNKVIILVGIDPGVIIPEYYKFVGDLQVEVGARVVDSSNLNLDYVLNQTRSPYHIFTPTTTDNLTTINLWIYKGDRFFDVPSEPTYTLQSVNLNQKNNFEVSELIRDFIEQSFDGNYSTEGVWCKYKYITSEDSSLTNPTFSNDFYLYNLNGFTYFEEGVNAIKNEGALISNNEIITPSNKIIKLPVNTDLVDNVIFYNKENSVLSTLNVTQFKGDDSSDKVYYVNISTSEVGSVIINSSSDGGDGGEFESREIQITNDDECIYNPVKLTFQNRFGVLQDIWFNKRNERSIKVKDNKYQANLLNVNTQSYDTSAHQIRIMNKNGNETLTLNSNFVPETYNEVFKQLLLSELVWVTTYEKSSVGIVRACNLKTSSLKEKTVLNDKLINYSIQIEIANKIINIVR